MRTRSISAVFAVIAMLATPIATAPASAHGGGTDASGCHTNRKTGDRHCHGGGSGGGSKAKAKRGKKKKGGGRSSLYSGGGSFANCSEARAAGAAPVRRGDPGYAPKLDRDGDGIGCE